MSCISSINKTRITLTLIIPGVRGVQVTQQAIPFRKTTVRMKFTQANVTMVTTNANRLRLTEPAVSPVLWAEKRLFVDGVEISREKNSGMFFSSVYLFPRYLLYEFLWLTTSSKASYMYYTFI